MQRSNFFFLSFCKHTSQIFNNFTCTRCVSGEPGVPAAAALHPVSHPPAQQPRPHQPVCTDLQHHGVCRRLLVRLRAPAQSRSFGEATNEVITLNLPRGSSLDFAMLVKRCLCLALFFIYPEPPAPVPGPTHGPHSSRHSQLRDSYGSDRRHMLYHHRLHSTRAVPPQDLRRLINSGAARVWLLPDNPWRNRVPAGNVGRAGAGEARGGRGGGGVRRRGGGRSHPQLCGRLRPRARRLRPRRHQRHRRRSARAGRK